MKRLAISSFQPRCDSAGCGVERLPPPPTHPPEASGTMAGEAVGKRGEAPRAGDGAVWEVEAGTLDEMPVLGNWEDTAEGAAATRGVAVAVTLALGKFVTATGEVTRSVVMGAICMRTLATGEVTRSVRNCSSRASQTARARSRSASAAAASSAGAGAGAGGAGGAA